MASKAWGPFELSLGLGWGYIGDQRQRHQSVCSYSDKYCTAITAIAKRARLMVARCPTASGVVGGIEYQTPWQPLV
ncbi:YjbH domain-containing protein [Shigella flexneri]